MNKKGQIGMNVAKGIFVAFLILSILGVTLLITMSSLIPVTDSIDTASGSFTNLSTVTVVNSTGAYISTILPTTYRNLVITITSAINQTGNTAIPSNNFTVGSNYLVQLVGTNDDFQNNLWNVSGTYVYARSTTSNIQGNLSSALTESFFDQTGTIFAIIIVVIIILALAIIIGVVTKFGTGGGVGASRGSAGSGTLMGV